MAKQRKFYVVWKGIIPGVYDNWADCKAQIHTFPDAKYKSFATKEEAYMAFSKDYTEYVKHRSSNKDTFEKMMNTPLESIPVKPINDSLAVDAACSGNPGDMEYRGVYTATGKEIFRVGPMKKGTNNIGEFLALVHGLALLKRKGLDIPIYSDSRNAISWVKKKKCKTLLERMPENEPIFDLIARAEKWLNENNYATPIYKWETSSWGEIPADFGRK